MEPVIHIENIFKNFGSLNVLKGIELKVDKGEIIAVIGPSGSGKSTLVRCINGLESVDAGKIRIDGNVVENTQSAAGKVGMVFQNFNLFPHYTVLQNLMNPLMLIQKKEMTEARDVALSLLANVRLSEKANVYPNQLSGGQKQRVAIARALSMNPEIILFDEPTSSLDPELAYEVFDTMKSIVRDDLTMIIVTHQLSMVKNFATRVLFLEDGQISFDGTPDALFTSEKLRIKQFIERIS